MILTTNLINKKDMIVDFINWYVSFFEAYWWAIAIIFLLIVIIAHIPNMIDFRYWDIKIPVILFSAWGVFELLLCFNIL